MEFAEGEVTLKIRNRTKSNTNGNSYTPCNRNRNRIRAFILKVRTVLPRESRSFGYKQWV